jgi:hypothetical protein
MCTAGRDPQGVRRPRGVCPECGRNVALAPKTRMIGYHYNAELGSPCRGIRKPPNDTPSAGALLNRLIEASANLDIYIERRARELAAQWRGDGSASGSGGTTA